MGILVTILVVILITMIPMVSWVLLYWTAGEMMITFRAVMIRMIPSTLNVTLPLNQSGERENRSMTCRYKQLSWAVSGKIIYLGTIVSRRPGPLQLIVPEPGELTRVGILAQAKVWPSVFNYLDIAVCSSSFFAVKRNKETG